MRDPFRPCVRWKWWHLWHAAGPLVEGTVTALLGTLPEQQSFSMMFLLTAFSYGKTWQQPLDSDPAVSLRSKQTNYSSVGLYSSSAATAPPAPSESTKTTKCAVASQRRALKQPTFFELISPWYSRDDGTQVFKCLTLMIRNSLHMYLITYRIRRALSDTLEAITYWRTHSLRHFCFHIQ